MPFTEPETDGAQQQAPTQLEAVLTQPLRYESRALAKGMQILERLAESAQPMSLAQISRRIQLGKASTLRLLRTLGALGYLERDGGEAYRVHVEWVSLHQQRTAQELRTLSLPILEDLRSEVEQSVSLAVLGIDEVRVAEALEGPHPDRIPSRAGRLIPPHASALGKAIAAHLPPERVEGLLHAYGVFPLTPATLVAPAALEAELASVREKGYARDREETVEGIQCFAAPVRDGSGRVVASVGVSLPTARLTERLEATLPEAVQRAAARISSTFHGRNLNSRGAATTT
jgi:IclR family acetate operon transcriptional repressor